MAKTPSNMVSLGTKAPSFQPNHESFLSRKVF